MSYEREIITDEYYFSLTSRLEEGWEVEKTEAIEKKSKFLFHTESRIIKVYHLRRDNTPTKLALNFNVVVPKWKIKIKDIDIFDFNKQINEQLIKLNLKREAED